MAASTFCAHGRLECVFSTPIVYNSATDDARCRLMSGDELNRGVSLAEREVEGTGGNVVAKACFTA